ncbi:coiled-coil domain-containing protein 190 [Pleurodeles waltl]
MHRTNTQVQDPDKQWEIGRRDDRRADVRLSHGLQDIEEARQYHINSMAWEKKRVQQDLLRIKQATATKKGFAADPLSVRQKGAWHGRQTNALVKNSAASSDVEEERAGSFITNESVTRLSTPPTLQSRINDFISMTSTNKFKTPSVNPSSALSEDSSTEDSDVVDVKQLMANRMNISAKAASAAEASKDKAHKDASLTVSTRSSTDETIMVSTDSKTSNQPSSTTPRRPSIPADVLTFDEEIYAPDGYLRTMHTMPDFEQSIEQAKKARYVRHRVNPEWNKELSVDEIFERKKDQQSSVAQKTNAGGSQEFHLQ